MSRNSKMGFYVAQSIWDFVLVATCAVSLTYVVLRGFYVSAAIQGGLLPALVVLVLTFLLFVVGSSRRLLLPGAIAYGLLVLGGCLAAAALTSGSVFYDNEANYLIFFLMCALVSTLVYCMTRKRLASVVLLMVGIFTCGWIEFFYAYGDVLPSLAFLLACIACTVYKNYQLSARTATSVRGVSFPVGFAMAAGTALLAIGVAALVWVCVIAPLNPSALNIKLITEHRAKETVEQKGTSTEYLTPDTSMTSDQTTDASRTTDDLVRTDDGEPEPARPLSNTSVSEETESAGSFLGIDVETLEEAFDFEGNPYLEEIARALALLLLVLVPLYFIGRRWWRRRRLAKILARPPTEQVFALFMFLTDRLARVGVEIPAGATVLEFALNNQNTLLYFNEAASTKEAPVSFLALTQTYVACAYGKAEATEEEAAAFAAYYRGFWKAARKQLGNGRYFVKSFTL